MLSQVVHANWSQGALHLWVELGALASEPAPQPAEQAGEPRSHPAARAMTGDELTSLAGRTMQAAVGTLSLRLPTRAGSPMASSSLAHAMGRSAVLEDDELASVSIDRWTVPVLSVLPHSAGDVLLSLAENLTDASLLDESSWRAGSTLRYYAECVRLARFLQIQQRVVPMLVQSGAETLGAWEPWMSDAATAERVVALVSAMPAAARAADDSLRHDAWAVTREFLGAVVDAEARAILIRESFADSIDGRDPAKDAHVAWLSGLLGQAHLVPGPAPLRGELSRRVRTWVSTLEERGPSSQWRLLLRVEEPPLAPGAEAPPPEAQAWKVTFQLQSIDRTSLVLDAEDVWMLPGESATIMGKRIDRPQELLLGELGRASRLYPRLESALSQSQPTHLALSTRHAYEFLREIRPVLIEQGFAVEAPAWWDSPAARLGAKLRLQTPDQDPFSAAASGGLTNAAKTQLGLSALVDYRWEISVGDATLTLHEFEQLASKKSPLVRVNGRWVEIRPEDVQAAIRFIRESPGGSIPLAAALRMAYADEFDRAGIPIVGLEATGWLQAFLSSEAASRHVTMLETPRSFRGALRPYQARGVSWMAFQESLGFGICLADDMGLGKTVQLLALMAWERQVDGAPGTSEAPAPSAAVPPTLLLVPMSVVGNWMHETRRFCPDLRLHVHHGPARPLGDAFVARAAESDLVVTTYALAHRDRELLARVNWARVVLDEAQYIKNPTAKQTQAVRGLQAHRRVALTGTPVENRLTELWSIMDFLNPGYLGSAAGFRTKFAVPIERYHDRHRAEKLRGLIRPFVLRRLKSDPTVVADLPEKVEGREYSHLTGEQASLYESCVKRMLAEVDHSEGIQRRGLVLATLVKLKQICNHPALALKEPDNGSPPDPARSGKCIRILEMLDEVVAQGDQALVFTQFREMGDLLERMFRHALGKEVLFMHGGTTQPQRQAIIDRFQKADGSAPVLILSLRAGGVGLNLTAATHVFHFDRWWNPAVENQATDRAYRIGQTRTVQVHKFVVRGTLEERIDAMIESKSELAQNIIGAGEAWISELSTDQLRDILTLRNDAVDDEA
ncbi:MAG: DEAD/DEAH box helicase [Phycisphaerales bacterium]|nr:DEAD/DEAH box helicase [Phycisphaerales bacterium]